MKWEGPMTDILERLEQYMKTAGLELTDEQILVLITEAAEEIRELRSAADDARIDRERWA